MKTIRTFLYIQNNVWVNKIIVRRVRTNAPKECWFISLAILLTISVQRKEQFTNKCAQFCMCISVSVKYPEFTIESSVLVCRTISLSPTGIRTLYILVTHYRPLFPLAFVYSILVAQCRHLFLPLLMSLLYEQYLSLIFG